MDSSQFNPIALYAAGLSTAVAAWNFYQWISRGPKLVGFASANMMMLGGNVEDGRKYVSLTISNRGDAETTITNVGVFGYENWSRYFRKKPVKTAVVNHTIAGNSIPFKLSPGGEFRNVFVQTDELIEWLSLYRLYMCVWHSMSDRPVRIRLESNT